MRQLIRTYTITGYHEITITGYTFTKEDVRLIIDETLAITDKRASVLVSSTAKNNIVSVINGVITLANTTAVLTVGDELTIEIDIDNVAKEATSQAILSSLPKFSVENDDTLVIYTDNDETEKRIPVMSTGVYRMKWSEELAEALDLEGAISTLIAYFIDDYVREMLVSASLDTHPISVQAMKVGEYTELFFIPLDGAGETYTLQELTDIVNDLWDGESYLYLQFRFNDFPFTESAGITFEELVEGYYWKLSYPLYVDSENDILSYPTLQDIILIDNSDESNQNI